jgi:hypothetical protein
VRGRFAIRHGCTHGGAAEAARTLLHISDELEVHEELTLAKAESRPMSSQDEANCNLDTLKVRLNLSQDN